MLKISKILAIVFAVLLFLWGVVSGLWVLSVAIWRGLAALVTLIGPFILVVFGVIDFILWKEVDSIEILVSQRRFREAKEKTLVWGVISLILGGVLPGIFLLIAYIKYDEVITALGSA
ncbi:MAG: hypothetical protein J7L55_05095 [Desulfurococcales archaeon]|nr:hypothetical protein [Desulfurococcales archaeon]